jgi:hypothetical protein
MIVFGGWDAVDPDFLIEFEDATFSLDFAPAPHWSWWTSPSGFEPVRSGHTAAFDPARGRMVTFGGGAIFGDGLNDTWLLELGSQPIRQAWLLGSQSEASSLALTWFLAQGPGATAVAERSSIGEGWHSVGTVTADNSSRALLQDTGLQSGWRYSYRLRSLTPGAAPMSADIVVTTAGSPSLRWLGAWPNPTSRSNLALQFVVGSVQPVDFELYDVVGRRAVSEKITPRSPGLLTIRPASSLGPGIYFARLTQDGHSVGGKVCVLQ